MEKHIIDNPTYTTEEYQAIVEEAARLIVHAANMRCAGHGKYLYMVDRVIAAVRKATNAK